MSEELPYEFQGAPFSVSDAARAGIQPARLRHTDLTSPFRGVRASRDLALTRVEQYLPLLRPGHGFSHGTAAVLWDMWLPTRLQRDLVVDVLAVGSFRPARMIGVRGHHADAGTVELVARDGVVLSSPGDTFRMLAPLLSLNELVEAGDSLVRRNCPLMTMEEVDRYVRRHARRRGAKRLKLAAELVRPGCDSPRETRVRLILSAFGLPEPEINLVVSRPGERVRYGDMVYPQWRVIVEYDGQHHTAGPQYAADIERLEQLARAGWTVVRILREHLANPASVAARVSTALRDNGWRP